MTVRCHDPACTDGPTDPERPDAQPGRWADDSRLLCRRCAAMLEQRLAEAKSRHDAVAQLLLTTLPSRGGGGNKPTKGSPPLPLNVAAHDWLVETTATLVSWTRMVCEERDLRGPDRSDVGVLSGWLLAQLDWLLQHGAVGDLADEVRDMSQRADGLTKPNAQRYRLEAPCPLLGCGERQLTREDGQDHVWCDACGGIWTEDQYPWMVRVALSAKGGSMTAKEAADMLGVTYGTFRNLVSGRQVRKLGTVDGTARYSTADVERLTKDDAAADTA